MSQPIDYSFLTLPVKKLNMSHEFKTMMVYNGFRDLHELLRLDVPAIMELPLFSRTLLRELLAFLKDRGLQLPPESVDLFE